MYIRNNKGPNTDPWGTPWLRVIKFDLNPKIETYCLRPKR